MEKITTAKVALLSVSDKTGLLELARFLVEEQQFTLISSGGTAAAIAAAGLPVTKVSDYTGAPEILGGRVKTLHPRIHGGILARLALDSDHQDLEQHQIRPITLVVVNLYPFAEAISQAHVCLAEAVEQIDIGGPAMLRAAAKNHEYVTVLSSPDQYALLIEQMRQGEVSIGLRRSLAVAAFQHTAAYDRLIAKYLAGQAEPIAHRLPDFELAGSQAKPLRYGENPHQLATWYQTEAIGWSAAQQLQGKELSYNNLLDLEAARQLVAEFIHDQPCAVIVKHNNPCGVALSSTLLGAYEYAFAADAVSAFGGVVALNQPLDLATAEVMSETFLECVVAPGFAPEALSLLRAKPNLRLLLLADLRQSAPETIRTIAGGILVQQSDHLPVDPSTWKVVTQAQPTPEQIQDLIFAWKVCRHVKSNAIVIAAEGATLGIGAGQMNRVGSCQIAIAQAGENAQGSVLASDGFFPFDDTVRAAGAAGIRAIIQPGGSIKDQDSIAAADQLGLVMILTGTRHFLH
ncbi:MAG: bifunctional phosphoribosylaminoimidazolecarboxamide formyltransferase/IMP cyclohydrolase [Pseudanabaenaceae cyanobacterium bins.68]|nr:bifunctional phosphoribosylaminoimidazolecarboxamide formyltransferase/IMP cyclohydrolase [Pseudanabaenaceae cyanobacterium bins.68]